MKISRETGRAVWGVHPWGVHPTGDFMNPARRGKLGWPQSEIRAREERLYLCRNSYALNGRELRVLGPRIYANTRQSMPVRD
jgi:hypothetical protein